MKFQSKFGLGEVVVFNIKRGDVEKDDLAKVLAVSFNLDKTVSYACRLPGGHVQWFSEEELIGDPDFDQVDGYEKVMK